MRTVIAGFAGGITMNVVMLLTFRAIGFGWNGGGILLTSPIQSGKFIAVWTQLKPLPLVVADPFPIIVGLIFFSICHALSYKWLSVSWPQGITSRALRLASLVYLTFVFWEFFTPFNLFGEPLVLIVLELLFWALIALTEAYTIAFIMERKSGS